MSEFIQQGPQLTNTFTSDSITPSLLKWMCSEKIAKEIFPELERLGERAASELWALAQQAEREQPVHIPYSPWGERVDEVRVSPAWQRLQDVAAEEGLIAIAYERQHGALSRVHQFAKLYLYHASSAFFTCPLAMADGAARVLEKYGQGEDQKMAFRHLTSRQPADFWTSGQWMTEKTGGSDVSGTTTIARRAGTGFELSGSKWFSSATTSRMALALARIEGAAEGSRGLSLFYVPLYDASGRLNGISVNRLKDKLGTKALPTAELTLNGCHATLVGAENQGVKTVGTMLNITRMYNSITAVSEMQRGFLLARDYSRKRQVFGSELANQPLHWQILVDMRVRQASHLCLTLHLAHLLGKEETGEISDQEQKLLRLLTPVIKLTSAKDAVANASETIEAIGGAGYIEDTGIPVLLRNSQVFPIWEGTTNVLSLDVLRVLKTPEPFVAYVAAVNQRLDAIKAPQFKAAVATAKSDLKALEHFVKSLSSPAVQQASCRGFAFSLGRVYTAALMLGWAEHELQTSKEATATGLARRYVAQGLLRDLKVVEEPEQQELRTLAFD